MYSIDISNFNNNSGLFALALVAKFTKNSLAPTCIQELSVKDLISTGDEVKQGAWGNILRTELSKALKNDQEHQKKVFKDSLDLCLSRSIKFPPDKYKALAESTFVFFSEVNKHIRRILKGEVKIANSEEPMSYAHRFALPRIETNWERLYDAYTNYFCVNNIAPTNIELNCLASAWGLDVQILNPGAKATDLSFNKVYYIIENVIDNHWQIQASDRTLTALSEREDDQFKSLLILDEALSEILTETSSSLNPSESGVAETLRETQLTYVTKANELILKPKNVIASLSFNDLPKTKTFKKIDSVLATTVQDLRVFKFPTKIYASGGKALGLGIGATVILEGASVAAGAEAGIFFTRALRFGEVANAARTLLSATNIVILSSSIAVETVMLARKKFNQFGESVREALKLYEQGSEDNDHEKLFKVDSILRSELGIGTDNRWRLSRSVIWAQAKISQKYWKDSDDCYALMYFILADIGSRLNKTDMIHFYELACASNNQTIKGLSALGKARLLANSNPNDPVVKHIFTTLTKEHPDIISKCFEDVSKTLQYCLWIIKTQDTESALNNVEKILKDDNFTILPYMKPHGETCAVVLLFLQGICFELKAKVVFETKNTNSSNSCSERKSVSKRLEFLSIKKFEDCCNLITDISKSDNQNEQKKISSLMINIKGYCKRAFENANNKQIAKLNITQLITKFNLDEEIQPYDSDEEFGLCLKAGRKMSLSL